MSSSGRSGADGPLRPPDPGWKEISAADPAVVSELMAALRLPDALCSVLAVRGIGRAEEAKRFLRPRLEHLHDPLSLADAAPAAERVVSALRRGETILVHGDYDVDGVCATALYTRWLRALGARVVPFVPHRIRDGYDLTEAGVRAACAAGAGLILTADCGTVAHEAVAVARAAGIDVVVTDHHTTGPELPAAHAVVNPQRPDCAYPDKGLCGTALAYKVCQLVAAAAGSSADDLAGYLDLVALATVADLVPLTGENRVLVAYGLRRFARTRVQGVRALLEVARVPPGEVTTRKLGFVLAPRINAAGRIGESADALALLLTDDPAEARALAERLDATNRTRQDEDQRTLGEAVELLARSFRPERDYGVVVASEGWHPGVIGIVASRVVELVHRPVVMIALDGSSGRGSARSIPGFHLYEALRACAGHLRRFGGHRQAAGLDVDREAIPGFAAAFNEAARERLAGAELRPILRPDVELDLRHVDLQLAHWLSYLGPHGIGNPGPLFLARGVTLERSRVVGENHLKATLRANGTSLEAIGFGLAARHRPDALGEGPHDVVFRIERNEWRGVARPQACFVDLRPSPAAG